MITASTSPSVPLKGVEILMMDAKSALSATSFVLTPNSSTRSHTLTISTSASVTGALQLETANDPTYAGTWCPLGSGPYDLATVTAAHQQQFQFGNAALTAIRARITTAVTGGTVSVSYLGV